MSAEKTWTSSPDILATLVEAGIDLDAPPSRGSTIRGSRSRVAHGDVHVLLEELRADADRRIIVGEVLGQGGMGTVFLADQPALDRQVAVKQSKDEEHYFELLYEAYATGKVEHPNIVPVHDLGLDEDDSPYIVLKRIEGEDWSSLMHEPPRVEHLFDTTDQLGWNLRTLRAVCNAIHFAHSRGIIHRDLKPDNVRIGAFGEVYVMDWGLAASISNPPDPRLIAARDIDKMMGTPLYMAPEMAATPMHPPIGAHTDIYLLGALLYEILVGHPPHYAEHYMAVVQKALARDPPLPDDAPDELRELLASALDRDPTKRPPTARAFGQAIDRFLEHRASLAATDEADADLSRFEALLEGEDADPYTLSERFSAARFGFRLALQSWPTNPRALEGLERALVRMIEYELGRGEASHAMQLLAELDDPAEDLVTRVEDANRERSILSAQLARFQREMDHSAGASRRIAYVLFLGACFTLLPFWGAEFEHAITGEWGRNWLVLGGAAVAFQFVGVSAWALGSQVMPYTTANRTVLRVLVLTPLSQLVLQWGCYMSGISPDHCFLLHFLLWWVIGTMLAIDIDRRFALGAFGYLVGFVVGTIQYDLLLVPMLSLCNFTMLLSVLWALSPQRGRR